MIRTLYDLSADAIEIILTSKNLLSSHLVRHKPLIDNSSSGFDCTYAQVNLRFFKTEIDAEIASIEHLQSQTNALLDALYKVRDEIKNSE